jgi:anti-anti-sigma regulatory factor
MSGSIHDRYDGPLPLACQTKPLPIASLLVYLRHDAQNCIATFVGTLTTATRTTIEGVADLIAAEPSVVLDLSRIEAVDEGGADAVEVLVNSVRAHGGHFQIADLKGRRLISLRP